MASLLIVDDEPMAAQMVRDMLEGQFDDIRVAADGEQALTAYRERPVDLVIADLIMPVKNGIDLILAIRKDYPDSRIIAISGGGGISGRFEYLPIAKMIGAIAALEKPFTLEAMLNAVEKAMSFNSP